LQEHTLRVKYPACSKHAGRTINQSLVIMDLDGLSFSTWNSQTRSMLQRLTGLLSDHYPETMGALFVVNAPGFFSVIWNVAKRFLDPGTQRKIHILGSNFEKELFEYIDPSNLPEFLGGTDSTFDLSHDVGPWVSGSQQYGRNLTVQITRRERRGGCLPSCIGGGSDRRPSKAPTATVDRA